MILKLILGLLKPDTGIMPAIIRADSPAARAVKFLMLKDGRIYFEGTAGELKASPEPITTW